MTRGFQPARKTGNPAARGFHPAPAQNYADGGIVGGIKAVLGLDPERAARIAAYKAEQAREKAAAAPAPAPAPAPGVRGLPGAANALRNRKAQIDAAAGYAGGGMVRGPGTGTSDDIETEVPEGSYIMPADTTATLGPQALAGMGSARGFPAGGNPVPVHLSNGEYQMPPEQVHAVGVETLNQIKDATHTPVAARGFPGGIQPQRQEPRMFFAGGGVVEDERKRANSFGDAAAVTSNSNVQQVGGAPRSQPLPTWDSPDAVRQQFQQWKDSGSTQAPAPTSNAGVRAMGAKPAPLPDTGASINGAQPNAAHAPPGPMEGSPAYTRGFGGTDTAPPASQVMPGVYQHGRGQYSDNPNGMGFAPGAGNPSASNIAAADALAARSAADVSGMVARGFQPQQQGPQVSIMGGGGFGLRDPDYLARRNAEVSASSMTNARDRNPKTGMSPAEAALANTYAMQAAQQKAQSDQTLQGARTAGELARTGMQEQGAMARSVLDNRARSLTDMAKLGVEGQKLADQQATGALEREKLGLGIQSDRQLLSLRDVALNPNASPEQRAIALQQFQTLSGKAPAQQPQLPTPALKMQQEELDALGISSAIGADLGAINQQLDSGQLNLGPVRNVWNRGRNALGVSTDESRNFASFESTLEKMRNDSLRLNKGVQTEGDAQRAWNEVLKNTSDPALVRKRLAEVQAINERAAELRGANVNTIRQNFGAAPLDTSQYRSLPSAIGQQQGQQQQPAQSTPADWGKQWDAMPSGTLYTAPDGSIRRKK